MPELSAPGDPSVERTFLGDRARSLRRRIAKQWISLRLRRKARQIKDYMEDSVKPEVVLDRLDQKEDGAADLLRAHSDAVAELSEPYRQIYLLRKANGLSHRDIGVRLGISVEAVEAHLLKGIEHCDRYVREWMELQLRRPPHLDQRERHVNVVGRENDKSGGHWNTGVDRARGKEVAHSDGRRRAAETR